MRYLFPLFLTGCVVLAESMLKAPNGYGLYDMTGNVWEWTWDGYGDYSASGGTFKADSLYDPHGSAEGSGRVFRGGGWRSSPVYAGSWGYYPGDARVADRSYFGTGYHYDDLGFRLARTNP